MVVTSSFFFFFLWQERIKLKESSLMSSFRHWSVSENQPEICEIHVMCCLMFQFFHMMSFWLVLFLGQFNLTLHKTRKQVLRCVQKGTGLET